MITNVCITVHVLAIIFGIAYNLNQRYPYLGTNIAQTINLLVVSLSNHGKRLHFRLNEIQENSFYF